MRRSLRCIWDPSCSVGVEQLDRQHQAILVRLGELARELPSADPTRIARATRSFEAECAFHFHAEEEFLQGLQYPRLAEQQRAHREFLARLSELQALPEPASGRVVEGLEAWLEDHVLGLDADYAQWMKEKAATSESYELPVR